MRKTKFRSICAIATAVDIVGDKWSLLIIRNMLFHKKHTYGELLDIPEKIATRVLADRLKSLAADGLIEKRNHPTNKKVFLYTLTDKGISTINIIVDLMKFSIEFYPKHIKIPSSDKNRVSYQFLHADSEDEFIKNSKKEYTKFKKELLAA
jgi:DNA-binding HxlR family transcriptional regulator